MQWKKKQEKKQENTQPVSLQQQQEAINQLHQLTEQTKQRFELQPQLLYCRFCPESRCFDQRGYNIHIARKHKLLQEPQQPSKRQKIQHDQQLQQNPQNQQHQSPQHLQEQQQQQPQTEPIQQQLRQLYNRLNKLKQQERNRLKKQEQQIPKKPEQTPAAPNTPKSTLQHVANILSGQKGVDPLILQLFNAIFNAKGN